MPDTVQGPEPSAYELMRGITRIEKRFDDLIKGFVTVEVYNLLAEDVKEVRSELSQEKVDRAADVLALRRELERKETARLASEEAARKSRAQQWFAIGLAGLSTVLTFIGGVALWSITSGLQALLPGAGG